MRRRPSGPTTEFDSSLTGRSCPAIPALWHSSDFRITAPFTASFNAKQLNPTMATEPHRRQKFREILTCPACVIRFLGQSCLWFGGARWFTRITSPSRRRCRLSLWPFCTRPAWLTRTSRNKEIFDLRRSTLRYSLRPFIHFDSGIFDYLKLSRDIACT